MILTKAQGNKILSELLKKEMQETGFTLQKGGVLRRDKKSGFEQIAYESVEPALNAKFRLDYSASKRINPVEEIWDEYFLELKPLGVGKGYVNNTLAFNARRIYDYTFDPSRVRNWHMVNDRYEEDATEEGLTIMSKKFTQALKQHVIPVFDKFNDIRALDAFINEKPDYLFEVIHITTGEGLIYKKLIIAKLAGNKEYDLIYDAVRNRIMNMQHVQGDAPKQAYLSVLEKIHERLESVSPLANPILD